VTKTQTFALNRPVAFPGTPAEAAANRETHWWMWYEEGSECERCAARGYHVAASYPCGQEPPRETVVVTRETTAK
jgi:hypothetical protein